MKRSIGISLAMLTLCGCASLPQESGQDATQVAAGNKCTMEQLAAALELERDLTVAYHERYYWTEAGPCYPEGVPAQAVTATTHAPATPALSAILAQEIQAGALEVLEADGSIRIVLQGDAIFASASAEVRPDFLPVLARIGAAINPLPFKVLVNGHTDSLPISTPNFPSNQDLSQARAEAAAAVLRQHITPPERLSAAGRGDGQPLGANGTREERARNRRVEIVLMPAEKTS